MSFSMVLKEYNKIETRSQLQINIFNAMSLKGDQRLVEKTMIC